MAAIVVMLQSFTTCDLNITYLTHSPLVHDSNITLDDAYIT